MKKYREFGVTTGLMLGSIAAVFSTMLFLFWNLRKHIDVIEKNLKAIPAAVTLSRVHIAHPVFFSRHAAAPDFVELVAEIIRRYSVKRVLELGCGTTTHYMSVLLPSADRGGYLLSIEDSRAWSEMVQAEIDMRPAEHRAQVNVTCAPLVPLADNESLFYDTGIIETVAGTMPGKIDLLIVDGPADVNQRRFAWPVLKSYLADDVIIIVDDGNHPVVRETVRDWALQEANFQSKYYATIKGTWVIYKSNTLERLPLP